jgi:hypothetical protein
VWCWASTQAPLGAEDEEDDDDSQWGHGAGAGAGVFGDAYGEAEQELELSISRHFGDLAARILDDTRFHSAAEEEFGELVLRYRFVLVCRPLACRDCCLAPGVAGTAAQT